ncbi:tetratricopeptide repeat protein [Pseudogemmatithrix spongiicola]|uniref:Tetratricopeptide repeat protein n=1 Tax=Pseudogemmatithrix spongiicola TaxID=3062599 RepID=A0AA49JX50_9BACT|nr:tetratricopeptide repeat protein [Gemmatimonadaceae bacterium 'strain 138']WKW16412.1 tetratricopeptide repeat protein [Gemmatimonadaceae bacterium 'strain 318']
MLLLVGGLSPLAAQTVNRDSVRGAIERGVIGSDWGAIDRAVVALRAATQSVAGRSDAWLHYDLAYALHRRASGLIVEDRASAAKAMLEEAVAAAGRARTLGAGAAAQGLEGGVTGQLAGAAGGLALMRFGRQSLRLLDEAVAAAPNDPRVALLNGITRVNAPAFAGGGAARGEAELRRAVALFATDRSVSPQPIWGRADAHIWLAIALEKQDKLAEARAELTRALELAPGHRWVVETLQPQLARRR